MDLLKNFNFKDLSHDLILDGSETFYSKIPYESGFPVAVEYPYPVEAPSKNIDNNKVKEFLKYSGGNKEVIYTRREFKRMKEDICNQDFKDNAVLPEYLINYIQDGIVEEVDYGFNLSHSCGTLEKFYNNNEWCLLRPNIDNNIEIFKSGQPKEKTISQWSCPDPIKCITNMSLDYTKNFIIRTHNNIYLVDLDEEFRIKINFKLRCDIGYLGETLNHLNGIELAFMDLNSKLKLFDLKTQKMISCYSMEELYFDSVPKIFKMNYITENMLMIMTEKHIKVLDNRCKDPPQEIEIKLHDCDTLLDFTLEKSKQYISHEVYLSSKHAFFIYDIRRACVDDYIHHNLRFPPCYVNCFRGTETKFVTLFGQSPSEAVIFGTTTPYSLPYQLSTLEETFHQCRSKKSVPVIPNVQKRLNYPITGTQIVANDDDVSIYFSNIFGELFRQKVLIDSKRSEEPFDRMYDWLLEIQEADDPDLNIVHLANARAAFQLEADFDDVDLFNHYEKCRVHDFLASEEFDFKNCDVKNFEEIWEDDNYKDELSLFESKSSGSKVEEWILSDNFDTNLSE